MKVWFPTRGSCDDRIFSAETTYSELYAGNILPSRMQTYIRVYVGICSTNEDKGHSLYSWAATELHTVMSTTRTTTAQTEISCINCTAIRQTELAGVRHTVPFHGTGGQKSSTQRLGSNWGVSYIFLMEASRCAYKHNTILNSVRQHNYFITQGNYIGYMFRL